MRFINTSDLMPSSWRFLESVCDDTGIVWDTVSGLPNNWLERTVPHPALARWRAAATAAWAARTSKEPRMLVSHLPKMAAATNLMRRALCPSVPQLAFAFNFTSLPEARRLTLTTRSLAGIDNFVVFSRFEQTLYAESFGIPKERFHFLPWAMEVPVPGPESPLPDALRKTGYLSAIGGEGRDYALLAEVMRKRPHLQLVVVARPYSIADIEFPKNVTVFTNLPGPATWRIAADSIGMAIPLKTDTTACGHITMVGAQLLGIPLIVTRSHGVADYVTDETAQLVPAGDVAMLGAAIDRLVEDPVSMSRIADAAQVRAVTDNALVVWVDYFRKLAAGFEN
jgi:hypothetical protein